jgi:hypothetical protein
MNLKTFLATIAGLIVAFSIIQVTQFIGMKSFPMETKIVVKNADDFKRMIESIPLGALTIIALGHGLAIYLGAIATNKLQSNAFVGFVIIAIIILVDVATQVIALPHPIWFKVFDISCVISGAIAGWKTLKWS